MSPTFLFKREFFFDRLHWTFHTGTLIDLNSKADDLQKAKIQIVAVSADPLHKSKAFAEELGLKYPVACELRESEMRGLGLYISDPKDYQPQDYCFSEPAYFLINPSGKIRFQHHAV